MGVINDLRYFFFQRQYQRADPRIDETYRVNLSTTTIAILFDGTVSENRIPAEALITELRDNGHEVYPLGYIDNYSVASSYPFKHFYKKHLNFALIPKHPDVDKFTGKNYTILINLAPDHLLWMHYLAKITQADFKVGPHKEGYEIYDLMIHPEDARSTQKMIESIKRTLKSIQYKK